MTYRSLSLDDIRSNLYQLLGQAKVLLVEFNGGLPSFHDGMIMSWCIEAHTAVGAEANEFGRPTQPLGQIPVGIPEETGLNVFLPQRWSQYSIAGII